LLLLTTNEQEQARHYLSVLELEPGASSQDVKSAYRELCLIWHPDKNPARVTARATRKLQHLNEAYAWLTEHAALLETGAHSHREKRTHQATHHLRREPMTVSDDEFKQKFNLDDHARPRAYIENKFEDKGLVVVDHATGLTWQKSGSSNSMFYQAAQAYIEQLNRELFGGYSDWRLPTVDELLSLMTRDKQSNEMYINPLFDKNQWWCCSSDKRSSGAAWGVYFDDGNVGGGYLDGTSYVRAVRS